MKNSSYNLTASKGFALVVGMIFLLVLTVLAIVVMRGTQLELAMSGAMTRQEQAFEASDAMRAITREYLNQTIVDGTPMPQENVIPEFAFTNNCAGGFNPDVGTSLTKPDTTYNAQMKEGITCISLDPADSCFSKRLQDVSLSPSPLADVAKVPYCVSGTDNNTRMEMAVVPIQLSVVPVPGTDTSSTADEQTQIYGLVSRGRSDRAASETGALLTVKSSRNSQ
jgi:hypothetical protein